MPDPSNRSTPSTQTEAEEEREAQASHAADRPPTDEESKAADSTADSADERVSKAFKEASETGADIKGEGQIES